MKKEYRQFWIRDVCSDFDCYDTIVSNIEPANELVWKDFINSVHVIEYEAYALLLAEAKKLRGVLVFYSDEYRSVLARDAVLSFDAKYPEVKK